MPLDADYAHCEALVRSQDRDRFLAALFAPAPARRHLFALYAFNVEASRVREAVREPLAGEMRLTWWREVIEGTGRGEVAGHPVASALLHTLQETGLPRAALGSLLEARTFDLYDDPMPSLNDLEGYAGETASALLRLSALVLEGGADAGTGEASGHGGVAQALTGLMRALPLSAARGQCYVPLDLLARHGLGREDVVVGRASAGLGAVLSELRATAAAHLAAAGAGLAALPGEARRTVAPAFLPLALVPGDLKALARATDPFGAVAGLSPLRRSFGLWRAAQRGASGRPWLPAP